MPVNGGAKNEKSTEYIILGQDYKKPPNFNLNLLLQASAGVSLHSNESRIRQAQKFFKTLRKNAPGQTYRKCSFPVLKVVPFITILLQMQEDMQVLQ